MSPANNGTPETPQTTGIGRGMTLAAWVLLLGLFSLLFSGLLERQHNPNHELLAVEGEQGGAEVVLQRNSRGHYLAPGRINGVPVLFLLDTGATNVALSERLAERIGLPRGASSLSVTANGTVRSWLTRLNRVELGSLSMSGVEASVLPGMAGDEVLLGMSFLKHLELQQQGDKLILRPPG
ncbi:retropepsin-like aspartic protease family protein [endosymbiont of Ridgeia piscesae]|nr:TIGR02281 family clan AA aspartic protease [endosymbiont of Ridgeia piscesae]